MVAPSIPAFRHSDRSAACESLSERWELCSGGRSEQAGEGCYPAANTHLRGPQGAPRGNRLPPTSLQGWTHRLDPSVPLQQHPHPLGAPEGSDPEELISHLLLIPHLLFIGTVCSEGEGAGFAHQPPHLRAGSPTTLIPPGLGVPGKEQGAAGAETGDGAAPSGTRAGAGHPRTCLLPFPTDASPPPALPFGPAGLRSQPVTVPGSVTRQGTGLVAVPLLPAAQPCPLPIQAGSQAQAAPHCREHPSGSRG